jgi:hypothetical protein
VFIRVNENIKNGHLNNRIMKQNLLKSLLTGVVVLLAQSAFADAFYFYNKCTQFEVVPSAAATVYATTKADQGHAENAVSDVAEGEPVAFYYNICAGYDDLYFNEETVADGYHFVGYKVINKAQNEDGSDNAPTQEEIDEAPLISKVPVLNETFDETGDSIVPTKLENTKFNIAPKTREATPDDPETEHDGVLNGVYVGKAYTADGGAIGWHDYPDAYVYIYYSNEDIPDGINAVKAPNTFRYVYNINGVQTKEARKGVNIVKMTDGTTRKVLKQ